MRVLYVEDSAADADLARRVLSLPVHPGLEQADLDAIVGAVNGARA